VASDQSVGAQDQKDEERQAHYQQVQNVKEGVDTLAHETRDSDSRMTLWHTKELYWKLFARLVVSFVLR